MIWGSQEWFSTSDIAHKFPKSQSLWENLGYVETGCKKEKKKEKKYGQPPNLASQKSQLVME